jgi:type III secretion protein Q
MTPLRPAAVSRTQASFINALAPVAGAVALSVAGRPGTLRWEPHAAPFEPLVALDLAVEGMPALLLLDCDPVATLLDLPLAAAEVAALPASLQASLVSEALADLIQQVSTQTGLAPEARALLPTAEIAAAPLLSDAGAVEVGWCIQGEDQRVWLRGLLHLSPNLAQRVIELAAAQPLVDGLAVDGLPLAARLELGRTPLTAAELGGLEPQDVVLVRAHRWGEGLVAVTISGNLRYAARLADDALTFLAREAAALNDEGDQKANDEADRKANDEADQKAPETGLSDIDQVTVSVTFDLGQLELAIGELRRVTEGYVLNLQRPLEGAVTLRVGGRLIGRGELVDIEGSLGVRVIEIFPRAQG